MKNLRKLTSRVESSRVACYIPSSPLLNASTMIRNKSIRSTRQNRQIRQNCCRRTQHCTASRKFLDLSSSRIPVNNLSLPHDFFDHTYLFPYKHPKSNSNSNSNSTQHLEHNHDDFLTYLSTLHVSMKRFDRIHPDISGNKFYKLKYNLFPSTTSTAPTLTSMNQRVMTFGGAFSNHIAATAAATNSLGIPSIGIIRGEELSSSTHNLNHTLSQAHNKHHMRLVYIDRYFYKHRHNPIFIQKLQHQLASGSHMFNFDDLTKEDKARFKFLFETTSPQDDRFFIPLYQRADHTSISIDQRNEGCPTFLTIPEGGTNFNAVRGTFEMLSNEDCSNYTHIMLPVGTGGTIAGITSSVMLHNQSRSIVPKVIGFPAVHTNEIDFQHVKSLAYEVLTACSKVTFDEFSPQFDSILSFNDFYLGQGYGMHHPALLDFIKDFEAAFNIPLDQVYTAKMCYGVFDMIYKQQFPPHSRLLILHTGGLQGKL